MTLRSLLLTLLLLVMEAAAVHAQIYVDARRINGQNDGTSWADAYTDLQDALAVATGTDEIWIAEGTYRPGTDRSDSFTITGAQDGLKIYGGFAGTEQERNQRDPVAHEVVLSGDVGDANVFSDNSYHVVTIDGRSQEEGGGGPITHETVLDGVTIVGGHADGASTDYDDRGAGMLCLGIGAGSACSPNLTRIVFFSNAASTMGGGLHLWSNDEGESKPVITNGVFANNAAPEGAGLANNGAIGGDTSPVLVNALFVDNAADNGGGMSSSGILGVSSPVVINATFADNTARFGGGAVFSTGGRGTSQPSFTNVILWGNTTQFGGAQMLNNDAQPTLTNTLVEGGIQGGGIENRGGGQLLDGGGNLDVDPLFANAPDPNGLDNAFGTEDDGLRLLPGSPALDAGTNAALPTDRGDLDRDADTTEVLPVGLAGTARVVDNDADPGTPARVDLGAYEAAPDTQLPVELTAFTARRDGEAIRLAWTTASETNNAGFEVQRSVEGLWEPLGFVEGRGTTTEAQTYRFTDRDLPYAAPGAMYRLRQVDTDGTETLSEAVEITRAAPATLALHGNFPNPFARQTTIRYELPQAGRVRLTVYDALGRQVATLVDREQAAGRKAVAFDAGRLASGLYFARLVAESGVRTRRLTVVR